MSTAPSMLSNVPDKILNPIRQVRVKQGKTLQKFADESHIHVQALYLNERGVYHEILPTIHYRVISQIPEADTQYRQYQQYIRQTTGTRLELEKVHVDDLFEPSSYRHPVVEFRLSLRDSLHKGGLSRMAFCKAFCVHPAELYSLENGHKHSFSEQFITALTEAGLDNTVIQELQYRSGEFARDGGC